MGVAADGLDKDIVRLKDLAADKVALQVKYATTQPRGAAIGDDGMIGFGGLPPLHKILDLLPNLGMALQNEGVGDLLEAPGAHVHDAAGRNMAAAAAATGSAVAAAASAHPEHAEVLGVAAHHFGRWVVTLDSSQAGLPEAWRLEIGAFGRNAAPYIQTLGPVVASPDAERRRAWAAVASVRRAQPYGDPRDELVLARLVGAARIVELVADVAAAAAVRDGFVGDGIAVVEWAGVLMHKPVPGEPQDEEFVDLYSREPDGRIRSCAFSHQGQLSLFRSLASIVRGAAERKRSGATYCAELLRAALVALGRLTHVSEQVAEYDTAEENLAVELLEIASRGSAPVHRGAALNCAAQLVCINGGAFNPHALALVIRRAFIDADNGALSVLLAPALNIANHVFSKYPDGPVARYLEAGSSIDPTDSCADRRSFESLLEASILPEDSAAASWLSARGVKGAGSGASSASGSGHRRCNERALIIAASRRNVLPKGGATAGSLPRQKDRQGREGFIASHDDPISFAQEGTLGVTSSAPTAGLPLGELVFNSNASSTDKDLVASKIELMGLALTTAAHAREDKSEDIETLLGRAGECRWLQSPSLDAALDAALVTATARGKFKDFGVILQRGDAVRVTPWNPLFVRAAASTCACTCACAARDGCDAPRHSIPGLRADLDELVRVAVLTSVLGAHDAAGAVRDEGALGSWNSVFMAAEELRPVLVVIDPRVSAVVPARVREAERHGGHGWAVVVEIDDRDRPQGVPRGPVGPTVPFPQKAYIALGGNSTVEVMIHTTSTQSRSDSWLRAHVGSPGGARRAIPLSSSGGEDCDTRDEQADPFDRRCGGYVGVGCQFPAPPGLQAAASDLARLRSVGSVRLACSRCGGQRCDDTATADDAEFKVTWSAVIEPTYHGLLLAGEDEDELATLIRRLEAEGATGHTMMPYDAPRAVPLSGREEPVRSRRTRGNKFPWRRNGGWHGGASLGWGSSTTSFTAGALVAKDSSTGIFTARHCVEGVGQTTTLVSPSNTDSGANVQTSVATSHVEVSESWNAAVAWLSEEDAAKARPESPRRSCENRKGLLGVLFDAFRIDDDGDDDDLERRVRLEACTTPYTFFDTLPPGNVKGRSVELHLVGTGRTTEAMHLKTRGSRVVVRASLPTDDVTGAQVSLESPTREFPDMVEMLATDPKAFPAKGDSGTVLYTLEETTPPTDRTLDEAMAGLRAAAVLSMRHEIPFLNICYGAPLSLRCAASQDDRGVLASMGLVLK